MGAEHSHLRLPFSALARRDNPVTGDQVLDAALWVLWARILLDLPPFLPGVVT